LGGTHNEFRGGSVSFLDALSQQCREELEQFVEDRVEQALRRHRPERRWVTVAECARLLGISERAVRGRADRGRLVTKRMGRSVLVDMQALNDDLEDST
jgi:excisionase family DNA binding protein